MAIELASLSEKLRRFREQFHVSEVELSEKTGITTERIIGFEKSDLQPTGDEILILADFYKCDFRFFITNKKVTSFEQTEVLFRRYGEELTKADRWAIQEVLFLAENEAFLNEHLGRLNSAFSFNKVGTNFKRHGQSAAERLREHLHYKENEVPLNVFNDFRNIGVRVFRRKLENSRISGLFINHPIAGKCILINYSEDIFRQRFTAAHEAAHSILDSDKEDVIISFEKWDKKDLVEIRANNFASHYLLPRQFIKNIPNISSWDVEKVKYWCQKLNVNTDTFAYSLMSENLIGNGTAQIIRSVKVPKDLKVDPELQDLSPKSKDRKRMLLERGLSTYYVNLCLKGYRRNIISASRMAEMLLLSELELSELLSLFGGRINYGD